jgi:hypothetical protein
VPNSLRAVDSDIGGGQTAVDAVLAIVRRSDEVRVRSEASRILVQIVRSLWSLAIRAGEGEEASGREGAKAKMTRAEVVDASVDMVRLSGKYPILVNEGIVGLVLLATSRAGGELSLSFPLSALLLTQFFVSFAFQLGSS